MTLNTVSNIISVTIYCDGKVSQHMFSWSSFTLVLHSIIFTSYWLLPHITIVEAILSDDRGMISLAMTKPFPKQQILDSSKLKQYAYNNFKFDENGRKFTKQVKNTVQKKVLFFPHCFQKTCTADRYKPGLLFERFNSPQISRPSRGSNQKPVLQV